MRHRPLKGDLVLLSVGKGEENMLFFNSSFAPLNEACNPYARLLKALEAAVKRISLPAKLRLV